MEPAIIAVGVMTVVIGIVALDRYASVDAATKRALRQLTRTRIEDLSDGAIAKVVGKLTLIGDPLTAPLSGRKCAYYCTTMEEQRGSGRSRTWVQIVREERVQDFLLSDGTGTALVRMGGARVTMPRATRYTSDTFRPPTEVFESFLYKHGKESRGLLFHKHLRYAEGILQVGETIVVGGLSRIERDPDPRAVGDVYRQSPARPAFYDSVDVPLLVSDDPKVGR